MTTRSLARLGTLVSLALGLMTVTFAQDKSADDVANLKAQLAAQQKQIEELTRRLDAMAKPAEEGNAAAKRTLDPATRPLVASTTPIFPTTAAPAPAPISILPSQTSNSDTSSPLQFKLGDAYFTPVGFMDMTSVTRSTNPGSGIGTNFGSIPYSNTQAGSLSETRLSPQNSRIGMRVDTSFRDINVLGYWESDFLGQIGNPPNGGLAVSSNPYVFRLRLFWVDVTKGGWEFLAGQSWSLATPNRRGVSPLPGDLFYSQDIDVNYQLGLTWGRIPGFRGAYHWGKKAALALAIENSEPYVGGGNGGSAIVAPAAIAGILGGQVNNGGSVISAAALHPDIIAKLAFDPSDRFHLEFVGLESTNKIANPASTPAFQTNTKAGGGGEVNFNFELFKGFRIVDNNYWSAGGGRYIFGQAPDFVIRADGSLSLVHSASTVAGFEATLGKTLFYGYYGGVYIAKNLTVDATGKLVGYGPIASDGQNRAIQEVTFGTNTTLAKSPKWGALNLMLQYSYLQRNPWLATGTAPHDASLSMGFVNLRYTLPGAPPAKQ
ncbi:MAG TPA: hypothetical protein VKT81_03935 [Bryobacteraceae bacterium]|nr:hypothetical protein [Bryobacteraceae bacterium]